MSTLIDPLVTKKMRNLSAPNGDSMRGDAHDTAFALRPGLETWVPKQAERVFGDLKWRNIKVKQTHPVAAKGSFEKVAIPAYERGAPQAAQQGNDFVVLHSLATDIVANLAQMHTPTQQMCPLTLENVLVQNKHA